MIEEQDNTIPIVLFRYLPRPNAQMVKASETSKLGDFVANQINIYDEAGIIDLDEIITRVSKDINIKLVHLNKKNDNIVLWHDDFVVIYCDNGKCFIERGAILERDDEFMKNTTQRVYDDFEYDTLRLVFFIVDVFDKTLPVRLTLSYQ